MIRSPRIQRELAAVARKYPGSQAAEDGGTTLLVIPRYSVSAGFRPSPVRIAIRIGALYPAEKLDLFWVDPALVRVDGNPLPNVMSTNIVLAGSPWMQISWHDHAPHDPARISILGYLSGIQQWFQSQVHAA